MRRYLTYFLVGASALLFLVMLMAWAHCARNHGYEVRWKENTTRYNNQRFGVLGRHCIVIGSHLIAAETTGVRGKKNSSGGGSIRQSHSPLSISWSIESDEVARVVFEDSTRTFLFRTDEPEFLFPFYFLDPTPKGIWPRWGKEVVTEAIEGFNDEPLSTIYYRTIFLFIPYWCLGIIFAVAPLWWLRGFLKRRVRSGRGFRIEPVRARTLRIVDQAK